MEEIKGPQVQAGACDTTRQNENGSPKLHLFTLDDIVKIVKRRRFGWQ